MKGSVTKIFYTDHVCDKAESNQANNLCFFKALLQQFAF